MTIDVIDLFAGAGGLGLGAALAGGRLRLSVENDVTACETLRLNPDFHADESIMCADVLPLTGDELRERAGLSKKGSLLIVGGAPCQPFSKAAYWTDKGDDARYRRARARGEVIKKPAPITEARPDDRRDLVEKFMSLVFEADADAFIFENVPSILHPRNKDIVPNLVKYAEEAGYKCNWFKLHAVQFGVAQKRERVFIVGSKGDPVRPPAPTHHAKDVDELPLLAPAVTAGKALEGLESNDLFEPEEIVEGRWARHLREVPPGWNYKALTAWAGHPSPSFEAETRFWNFLLKLSPDKPSWTLAATPGPWTGPFHWNNRRLRTVEMAALQSFPRDYKFAGNRRERVRQIGNAVPPLLAKAVVETVIASIVGGSSCCRAA